MEKIPEWQYPLYESSDKYCYSMIKKFSKKVIGIRGGKAQINQFLKFLIISQKIKNYRKLRDVVIKGLEKGKLDIIKINKDIKISKGIEKWAIFKQDKRLCKLIDDFKEKKIDFKGNNKQISEFILRFILSQLLMDWRGPLFAVILECLKYKEIQISKLNNLLKRWDYTRIF